MIATGSVLQIRIYATPHVVVVMRRRAEMDAEAEAAWAAGIAGAQLIDVPDEAALMKRLQDVKWLEDRPVVGAAVGPFVPGRGMEHPPERPKPTVEVVVAALQRKGLLTDEDLRS